MEIRELRIGSTVWFNDKRVKITAIDNTDDEPFVKTSFRNDKWLHAKLLDPIPLTEELLKELGFEEEKPQGEGWDYGIEKVFSKEYDAPTECEYPRISMAQYEGGLYQLQVLGTIAYVRNLHELQGYVYFTTKLELI